MARNPRLSALERVHEHGVMYERYCAHVRVCAHALLAGTIDVWSDSSMIDDKYKLSSMED